MSEPARRSPPARPNATTRPSLASTHNVSPSDHTSAARPKLPNASRIDNSLPATSPPESASTAATRYACEEAPESDESYTMSLTHTADPSDHKPAGIATPEPRKSTSRPTTRPNPDPSARQTTTGNAAGLTATV